MSSPLADVPDPWASGRAGQTVQIHYRRLPDRLQVFEQVVVAEEGGCIVTLLPMADLRNPVRVGGRTVLEPGAPVVWFTYHGRAYDAGRFHLADGTFTGVYANMLSPVQMNGSRWDTTDLCLDVWVGADGAVELLDEDEFQAAVEQGWIDAHTAAATRWQADILVGKARRGTWPPAHIHYWTLERVQETLREFKR